MNSLRKLFSETPLMVLLYTGCIFFTQLAYGVSVNMIGPAMIDVRYVYHTTDIVMFYGVSALAAGYTLGSFVGWLYQWLNRQVVLAFFLLLMAVCSVLYPNGGQIWLLLTVMTLWGVGAGAMDTSINVWLVELWPKHNSAILQGSQFTYGVGAILGPLMVTPCVFGEDKNKTLPDGTNYTVHHSGEERRHALLMPFVSAGVIQVIVPAIFLVTYFYSPYRRPSEVKDNDENIESPKRSSPAARRRVSSVSLPGFSSSFEQPKGLSANDEQHVPYRVVKLALAGLTFGLYACMDTRFLAFLSPALQYLPIELSAPAAAVVVALTNVTYTFGRLVAAFVSLRLSPDIIIIYHFVIAAVSLVSMYIASMHSIVWLIYPSAILIGFGFSAVVPALFAWTEHHLKLTDRANVCISFIFGLFGLSYPLLLGTQLKNNPVFIYYMTAALCAASAFTFVLAKLMIHFSPARNA